MIPEKIAAGNAVLCLPERNDSSAALSSQICTISNTAIRDMAPAIAVRPRVFGGRSTLAGVVMMFLCRPLRVLRREIQERSWAENAMEGLGGPTRQRWKRIPCGTGIRAGCSPASNKQHTQDECISG